MQKNNTYYVPIIWQILLPLAIFAKLAYFLEKIGGFSFDVPLLTLVHNYQNPTNDVFMQTVTLLGGWQIVGIITLLVCLILFVLKKSGLSAFYLLSVTGAYFISVYAKLFFHRLRPDIFAVTFKPNDYSFPSGHAMASMAIILSLILILWPTRLRWLSFLLGSLIIFLVGFSRVYLGVHYPSDVLAGWCLSAAWVFLLYQIIVRPRFKK